MERLFPIFFPFFFHIQRQNAAARLARGATVVIFTCIVWLMPMRAGSSACFMLSCVVGGGVRGVK